MGAKARVEEALKVIKGLSLLRNLDQTSNVIKGLHRLQGQCRVSGECTFRGPAMSFEGSSKRPSKSYEALFFQDIWTLKARISNAK